MALAFTHRKIGDRVGKTKTGKKYKSCDVCFFCPYDCTDYSQPPPPPPTTSHHQFSTVFIFVIGVFGVLLLLFSYLIIRRYRSILRNSRRMNQPPLENDNQGPVMDHHVWYIRTAGLPQSSIDSIPVFDYRRGEKKIEGSDHCSVCLSEFQENESLRLLPKCGHAFHVLCIDTWLRSHKNCPVCRSPVSINNTNTSVDSSMDMGTGHSGSISGPEFETNERTDTRGVDENRGESRIGCDKMAQPVSKKLAFRVLSDLSDRRVEVDREMERVRRSVSMDYSSDSLVEIHANKLDEGCSDT